MSNHCSLAVLKPKNTLARPAPQSSELLLESMVTAMAAKNSSSILSTAPKTISGLNVEDATGIDDGEKVEAADDDRSSSLSELGDRAGIEHSSRAGSEANETEAETERLEDSPHKQRRQRDVLLTSTNSTYGDHQNRSVARTLLESCASPGQISIAIFHQNWLTVS